MRGQDHQARIFHGHELHQHVVGRMVGAQGPAVVDLVAVVAGGFVAVMAVGDKHRLGSHQAGQLGNQSDVGHRPEPMAHPQ